MSNRKRKYGKQVYNKFIAKQHYTTIEYYEKEVQETIHYLERATWLYRNRKIGIVKVFRNKIGARIIAYDLPE